MKASQKDVLDRLHQEDGFLRFQYTKGQGNLLFQCFKGSPKQHNPGAKKGWEFLAEITAQKFISEGFEHCID